MHLGPDITRGSHRSVSSASLSRDNGLVGPFLFGLLLFGMVVLLGSLQAGPAQGEVNTNLSESPFVAVSQAVRDSLAASE